MRWRTLIIAGAAVASAATGTATLASVGAGAQEHGVPSLGLTADEASALRAAAQQHIPPEQADAVRDGKVDRGEYLAAAAKSAACFEAGLVAAARDAGIAVETSVRAPVFSADGYRVDYSVGIALPGGVSDRALADLGDAPRQIDARCQQQYLGAVRETYQIGFLEDRALVERTERSFRQCLAGAGVDLGKGDLRGELGSRWSALVDGEHADAVIDCVGRHPSVTDDPRLG